MKKNRFQSTVATSYFTFPVAAIISTLLWCSEGIYTPDRLLGWAVCGLVTYLWVETNNAYSLLRIRSRLTAVVYALLMGGIFFLHPLQDGSYVVCCMVVSYYLLFGSYQLSHAIVPIFHAFLFIGIGSLFFPQLLYFVPFYLWYSASHLRSLTWRTFWSAMTGIILPYWFLAGYYLLFQEDFTPFLDHFRELTVFQPVCSANYAGWEVIRVAPLAYVAFFSFIGIVHYVRTSFNDKIRTRMMLYVLLSQEILITVFLVLQPVHFNLLFGLLAMNSAPFISHYFALTDTRLSHILFLLAIWGFIALAALNIIWTHSLIF